MRGGWRCVRGLRCIKSRQAAREQNWAALEEKVAWRMCGRDEVDEVLGWIRVCKWNQISNVAKVSTGRKRV